MTNQETFDAVCKWLRRDGATRCVAQLNGDDQCIYYRESDGNRCGIGGIVPLEIAKKLGTVAANASQLIEVDSEYEFNLESATTEKLRLQFGDTNPKLLNSLQVVHDSTYNWDTNEGNFSGEDDLKTVANQYGLTYTEA